MIQCVGHVDIAVKNIEESLTAVSKALDLPIPWYETTLRRK